MIQKKSDGSSISLTENQEALLIKILHNPKLCAVGTAEWLFLRSQHGHTPVLQYRYLTDEKHGIREGTTVAALARKELVIWRKYQRRYPGGRPSTSFRGKTYGTAELTEEGTHIALKLEKEQ